MADSSITGNGATFPLLTYEDRKCKFQQTLDLDALSGHLSYLQFEKLFKGDISFSIDNALTSTYNKKIALPYLFKIAENRYMNISKLPHIKIGVSYTKIGILDIYIVLTDSNEDSHWLKEKIFNVFNSIITGDRSEIASSHFINTLRIEASNSKKIVGNFLNKDAIKVLGIITETVRYEGPVIYIESYGNKRSTVTGSINLDVINERIFSVFNKGIEKYIDVDICISTSLGVGKVTLANESFFQSIDLIPNYHPLFTDTIKNLHLATVNNKTGQFTAIGRKFKSLKLNFYSTFKYHLNFDESKYYMMPLSTALMMNNFFGHRIFSHTNKFEKLVSSYENINQRRTEDASGTCMYRTEIRCRLSNIEYTIRQLKAYLIPENFSYYLVDSFFDLLQANVDNFISLIKTGNNLSENTTTDSLVFSIISEYVFRVMYLTGMDSSSILSKENNETIKLLLPKFNNSIGRLINIQAVINNIQSKLNYMSKLKLIKDRINYSHKLSTNRKYLLTKLLKIAFKHFYFPNDISDAITMDEFIKYIFKLHVVEKTNNRQQSMEILRTPVENDDITTYSITALRRIFLRKTNTAKSSISKLVFDLFIRKFGFSIEDGLLELSNYMERNNITTLFRYEKVTDLTRLVVKFTREEVTFATEDPRIVEKTILLTEFMSESQFRVNNNRNVSDSEIIRFVNALFKYRNSGKRIINILKDYSYGFYPIRSIGWIKNRIHFLQRIIESQETFNEFIRKIKEWSPSQFDIEERLSYMAGFGVVLNNRQLEIYSRLTEIDKELWIESSIREDITASSSIDLFYGAVQNSYAYLGKRGVLESWSNNMINNNDNTILESSNLETNPYVNRTDSELSLFDVHERSIVDNNIDFLCDDAPYDKNERLLVYDDDNDADFLCDSIRNNDESSVDLNDSSICTVVFTMIDENACMNNDDNVLDLLDDDTTANKTEDDEHINYQTFMTSPYNVNNETFELQEELAVPSSNNDASSELINESAGYVLSKMYEKLRYKKFNPVVIRNIISYNKRPSLDRWSAIIDLLTSSNRISKISSKEYKVNIISRSGKYISYDYITKVLKNNASKDSENLFTSGKVFNNIRTDNRPSANAWKNYIDDLVIDGLINITKTVRNTNYYRLE